MRQATWLGVGMLLVSAALGCSDDADPSSEIGQAKGGSGGSGGQAGSLSLALPGGAAGNGGGGAGGMSGSTFAGTATGGSPAGGVANHAGSSSLGGSTGTGGSKPGSTCKRTTGSDANCADFYAFDPEFPDDPARPQAYACDDTSAYVTLNGAHGGKCASVNFVTGAKYGACCPP